ncbi:hypothetical protein [Bittarella massiliensis (ex Durand et al. 2017)]|uniref:Uncharacterized protein n=1 Tax=Bittarella massiliensis (ex Durand et al. 2017) TaxID=1720313 RepID=A0AAW5KC14_9FIRM|nr:hypothetical protein [Bittarella massiliensis (ex Durand et al. 2017)]MCQ4948856.1 hypothetical protein [Bittarella massiliensis (ex Durand et al. 2017)]
MEANEKKNFSPSAFQKKEPAAVFFSSPCFFARGLQWGEIVIP